MEEIVSKYQEGDRFETLDSRDAGRIIEIDEVIEYEQPGVIYHDNDTLEEVVLQKVRYRVHSEANPKNPNHIGRRSSVSEEGLTTRYKKISR